MSKTRKYSTEEFDDGELFSDRDFDLDSFMQTMEDGGRPAPAPVRRQRAGWQRVEDLRDARQLKSQLDDWVDWED